MTKSHNQLTFVPENPFFRHRCAYRVILSNYHGLFKQVMQKFGRKQKNKSKKTNRNFRTVCNCDTKKKQVRTWFLIQGPKDMEQFTSTHLPSSQNMMTIFKLPVMNRF